MTRYGLGLLAAGAVLAAAWAGAAAAAGTSAAPALGDDGPLVEHAGHLSRLLGLRVEAKTGRLLLDRDAWKEAAKASLKAEGGGAAAVQNIRIGGGGQAQIRMNMGGLMVGGDGALSPADAIFEAIRQEVGGAAVSRQRMGSWAASTFGGGRICGSLRTSGDLVEAAFTETAGPGRTIEVLDDPDGPCRLTLSAPGGDLVLVNQGRQGRCVVVTVAGDEATARAAASFAAYRQAHPAEADAVLAALAKVGASPPLTPDSPPVREAVLKALRGLTGKTAPTFQQFLKDLDDADYRVRERATVDLTRRFGEFEAQVRAAQEDAALSAEVKNRLDRVVRQSRSALDPRLAPWMRLTQDVPYLIGLLDASAGEDRAAVAAQLGKLTGQSLGDDPAAWRKWHGTARPGKP
jgi:hypothetical protein